MSYIQGTQVRLRADFTDPATKQLADPIEVILTIEDPLGVMSQFTLSADQVQRESLGRFYFILDTSAMPPGPVSYEFESTGNEATVGRKEITIRPRLGVAP